MERVEPGKVVSAVHVDRLQQSDDHPRPHQDHVVGEEEDAPEETHAERCNQRDMHTRSVWSVLSCKPIIYNGLYGPFSHRSALRSLRADTWSVSGP